MAHYHICKECQKAPPCEEDCDIDPDLQQGKYSFGSARECDKCEKLKPCIRTSPTQTELADHAGNKSCRVCNPPVYDQEWFDNYNGVIR
jgi:hypothetical protein